MPAQAQPYGGFPPPPAAPARVKAKRPIPPGPPRWPVAVALLNLTGLSLGYLYLRLRLRAALYFVVTAGLVVTALLTGAASLPWLWRGIAVGWLAWMAFDGWRLARRNPESATARGRRPALVATAVIVTIAAGYVLYGVAGDRAFAAGQTAQAEGDCTRASARYDEVTGPYELTLSGNVAAAEQHRAYCSSFVRAVAAHEGRQYELAVSRYHDFLAWTPANSLDDHVHDRLQRVYLEWGNTAQAEGDYDKAIKAYRDLLGEYAGGWSAKEARTGLARAYFDEAAAYRSTFSSAEGVTVDHLRTAMENYLVIQKEFSDTVAAVDVPKAMGDTFNEAIRPLAEGKVCESLPVLDYLISLPRDESANLVPTAHEHRVKTMLDCGVRHYGAGRFDEAGRLFDRVTTAYANHALANAARSALIATTIALEGPATVPALPPPLGGDSPGTISVTFYNVSSIQAELLVSGATAHRFVLPGCASCPDASADLAAACTGPAGRPAFELRLQPGSYHVLVRAAGDTQIQAHVDVAAVRAGFIHSYCVYHGANP
jgi:tetratricopeptide (TPR) repeat protein